MNVRPNMYVYRPVKSHALEVYLTLTPTIEILSIRKHCSHVFSSIATVGDESIIRWFDNQNLRLG